MQCQIFLPLWAPSRTETIVLIILIIKSIRTIFVSAVWGESILVRTHGHYINYYNKKTRVYRTEVHQTWPRLKLSLIQTFSDVKLTFETKLDLRYCFINSREAISEAIIGLLLVFHLFRRQDFCYDHMTSQPLQICFLFIRSCNFNWIACATSFFTLSGASFFVHSRD